MKLRAVAWAGALFAVLCGIGLGVSRYSTAGKPAPLAMKENNDRANEAATVAGDAAAGKRKFTSACAACHPSPALLKPKCNSITNNLGALNPLMNAVKLSDQEVADLKAYLAGL